MYYKFAGNKHIWKLLSLIASLLIISSCDFSPKDISLILINSDLEPALWIGTQEETIANDSLHYKDNPAPLFRKEFNVNQEIQSAILHITAAGYYIASLNGEKTGQNYLDPAWTDVSKRIYTSEYDLSKKVKQGTNCLGVTLGNGFYNPLPMKMWGSLNLRKFLTTGQPIFIAKLLIEYKNGQVEEIITDNSWKFHSGPVRKNNVYLGEVYDARCEIEGWALPGFNDQEWEQSIKHESPGGKLQKSFFPAIQITNIINPLSISAVANNKYIVDMGENFTGLFRIRLRGAAGDTISFRFGERVYENGSLNPMTTVAGQIKKAAVGGPGAPAVAWQEDKYIFGDKTDILYSPQFTFHTYRYMEITDLKKQPLISEIEGLALNSNVKDKNNFSCSVQLINMTQKATKRTFLSNLLSVQSDCPAREKFGYGGDLNATCEAFIYNFDMQNFYRKTIFDWVDAINDSCFIDTAPFVGIQYCGLSWESAFLTTQYNLYLYYNDTAIVKELYELDLKWMEKAARIHPNGLVDAGLGDHESLEAVPVELTGTSHYLHCARIMKEFASYMDDRVNKEKFDKLATKLRKIILDKFWSRQFYKPINKQTQFATLLYYNIIPENEKNAAIDSLLEALSVTPSGHFTTGIFGTKYILEALSKSGHVNLVYNIINSTDYPGWGYMIDQGATTIWETWKESDNTYSNCHPMFGSVSEWLFRWLGGIRPDPDYPGFEQFIINPSLPEGLSHVSSTYHSPFGEIKSNWKNINNEQTFEIKIPEGSKARIELPLSEQQMVTILEKSKNTSFSPDIEGQNQSTFELTAGEYIISTASEN